MCKLLEGKTILVMGVRNKWSIAWGIAKEANINGAKIIFSYLSDREKDSLEKLVIELDNCDLYKYDLSNDDKIDSLLSEIKQKYGKIDGIVHAIAHANTEDLQNDFVYTSREGFSHAMDVSAYSLVAVCKRAIDVMESGSIITLTYLGSEKVVPGYNVMGVAKAALEASVRYLAYDMGKYGVRVNAISAGPIKTRSANGVKNFNNMLEIVEENAPLHKGVELEELGKAGVYLLSDMSKAITGEIQYVDCGYNIMGL